MGGLFASDTANKYNKQQAAMTAAATKKSLKQFTNEYDDILENQYNKLLDGGGFRPVSYTGPGHNINIDGGGNINMGRTAESQGFMDRLLAGLGNDENAFTELLSQIRPGFGRLSDMRGREVDQARERGVSNLRDQLAKRRVLGASFANDQIGSLERQYMMDKDKVLAEAWQQEMEATMQALTSRTQARNQTITTALNEIQFETGVGAQLLQQVSSSMQDMQMAMVDIAKLRGSLMLQRDIAKSGIVSNLAMPGLQSQTEFANLESQEKAAPGQLLGSLAGMAIGGFTGGLGGFGALGSMLGGAQQIAGGAKIGPGITTPSFLQ
jgi:hypothetical protein